MPGGTVMKRKDVKPFLLLIGPAALFTVFMTALPFLQAIRMSFQDFMIGFKGVYVGFENYSTMLKDPMFWNGLRITFELYSISLFAQLLIGLYIAVLLNRGLKGSRFLRTILLSPFTMPSVAVGMMWLILMDPSFGPLNYVLELVGMKRSLFLASPALVIRSLAAIDTWQYTPFVVIILLGGLQSLPEEPYEAAEIDGASRRQMFFSITLPLLRPSIFSAVILRSIDLLRFFDTIYITTQGGPGTASTTLNVFSYNTGFVFFKMGYASALMVTLMALVMAFVVGFNQIKKRWV